MRKGIILKELLSFYEEVVDLHFDDITGDDALYNLAKIYYEQLRTLKKLKRFTLSLLFEFSGSLYTVEARKRYREITGELEE